MSKLSIITINYNNIKGLIKTYNSICIQTKLTDLEWIIVDGNSSDSSTEFILNMNNKNIKYKYVIEADLGIYDAMNKGIKLAENEFIIFLNSGDTFFNCDSLNVLLSNLNSKFDFFLYGFLYKNKKRLPKNLYWRFWSMPTSHQAIIYKKNILDELNFSTYYKYASDYEHFLNLCNLNYKFKNQNIILIENEEYGSNNFYDIQEIEYTKIYQSMYGSLLGKILAKIKFTYLKRL